MCEGDPGEIRQYADTWMQLAVAQQVVFVDAC